MFWLSVPAAGAIMALVGLVLGIRSVRIKGLYLVIATLAAQVMIEWALSRAIAGTGSVAGPPPNAALGRSGLLLRAAERGRRRRRAAENILRTRIRDLIAVRAQDIAASVIGVSVARQNLLAFGLSSFYAGIAGACAAISVRRSTSNSSRLTCQFSSWR